MSHPGRPFPTGLTFLQLLGRTVWPGYLLKDALVDGRVPAVGPRHTCFQTLGRRVNLPGRQDQAALAAAHSAKSGHRPLVHALFPTLLNESCGAWGAEEEAAVQCQTTPLPRRLTKGGGKLALTSHRDVTHITDTCACPKCLVRKRGADLDPIHASPPPCRRVRPRNHLCQTEMLGPWLQLLIPRIPGPDYGTAA